jgi:hypothetical protein
MARIDTLAERLAATDRLGLNPELATKLGVKSVEATRGQLMALEDDDHGHLGIYLLAIYVVDDTDFWDDGEIYWFSMAALLDKKGKAQWSPLTALPSGSAPHKCGSLEWMTNISLADPPLLALIPPDDEVASAVVRVAIYDDDAEPANLGAALSAGMATLGGIPKEVSGSELILSPVRQSILASLKAEDDDILIDTDITLRRGSTTRFGCGLVSSEMNSMARVFLFVRDERRTEQIGPFVLHKGQIERVRFQTPLAAGGRVALFTRGAEVTASSFGSLNTETPFLNRIIDAGNLPGLRDGFDLVGTGSAKVIAFYTPP